MTRNLSLLTAACAALISATAAPAAHALDFTGYLRTGPGQKTATGDNRKCYNGTTTNDLTFSHGGVGRLGNECDTYGEFMLTQGLKAGNVDYGVALMSNIFNTGSDIGSSTFGIPQAFVYAKGLDFAPDQTFWIGKRFGDRFVVHFDDYFPINLTGTGAGVDGVRLGKATLALGVFRDGDNPNNAGAVNAGTRYNADLVVPDVNPGGKLRLVGVATSFSGPGGQSGYGMSVQHMQAGVIGGEHSLLLQYAQGSAEASMNSGLATNTSDRKTWRIIDSITWANGPLSGQAMVRYGQFGVSGAQTKFSSAGGRIAYAFTQNFKLQGEAGVTYSKLTGGNTQRLTKFTIAPTLSVGPNFLDRPELRFYVSRFGWNDAYGLANTTETRKGKTSAGFQAEIWF